MDIRKVIAENLKTLKANNQLTNLKMAKLCHVSEGTINRAMSGDVGVASDVLSQLAQGFGLHTWQLLVPNLDPSNPPLICQITPEEQALYARLRAALKTTQ